MLYVIIPSVVFAFLFFIKDFPKVKQDMRIESISEKPFLNTLCLFIWLSFGQTFIFVKNDSLTDFICNMIFLLAVFFIFILLQPTANEKDENYEPSPQQKKTFTVTLTVNIVAAFIIFMFMIGISRNVLPYIFDNIAFISIIVFTIYYISRILEDLIIMSGLARIFYIKKDDLANMRFRPDFANILRTNSLFFSLLSDCIFIVVFVFALIVPTNFNIINVNLKSTPPPMHIDEPTEPESTEAEPTIRINPDDTINVLKSDITDSGINIVGFDSKLIKETNASDWKYHAFTTDIINRKDYSNGIMNTLLYAMDRYSVNPSYLINGILKYEFSPSSLAEPADLPESPKETAQMGAIGDMSSAEYTDKILQALYHACADLPDDCKFNFSIDNSGVHYNYTAFCEDSTINVVNIFLYYDSSGKTINGIDYTIMQFTDMNGAGESIAVKDYDCRIRYALRLLFPDMKLSNTGNKCAVLAEGDDTVFAQQLYGKYSS